MINCNDPRKNCGSIVPSSCVPFTGPKPDFVADIDFPCDVNVTDIITLADAQIDKLTTDSDLTALNARCLTFTPAIVTPKALHQVEIDKICALDASVTTLQTTLADLNIGTELVTVDLGAMSPLSNPCSVNANQYTLFYVLQAFANELNLIKTNLGI